MKRARYKDTSYAEVEVLASEDTGRCAIAACDEPSKEHVFVTILGRLESAYFCSRHYAQEREKETFYRMGL